MSTIREIGPPSKGVQAPNRRDAAISAGVAVLGSTLAMAQVNPRSVHTEVVCWMSRFFISSVINFTTSSCMITALLGTKVPTPIA